MRKSIEERLQLFEDIQEITKLKARYCTYCDGGWDRPTHEYDKIAELFVEDGVWDARPFGGMAEGREAIRALFKELRAVPFAVHFVTNPIIEVNGDIATGNWHVIVPITPKDDKQAFWCLGIYNEEYVRTPDGWRYKTLRWTPAAFTPYEIGWGKAQFRP